MKQYQKIAEIATTLVNEGYLQEAIEILGGFTPESSTKEAFGASKRPFQAYQLEAEAAFLKQVVSGIKKLAGGHAEQVSVQRTDTTVWLEYVGQDRSDNDLNVTMTLLPGVGNGSVTRIVINVKSVYQGADEKEFRAKSGRLTPAILVDYFGTYFN